MKTNFIQCDLCKKELKLGTCEFANYAINIGEEKKLFCCPKCFERNQKQK